MRREARVWRKRRIKIELQSANSARDGPRAVAALASVPLAFGAPPDEIAIVVLFGERCHWFARLVLEGGEGGREGERNERRIKRDTWTISADTRAK
jgi:hypothetical protein